MITLHRGIAVAQEFAQTTMDTIRREGLVAGSGFWTLPASDLKERLEDFWQLPHLSLALTRRKDEEVDWICGCVRKADAIHYACVKNRTRRANRLNRHHAVIVDGRDLLYTVFQRGDPEAARSALETIFGSAVLRYADRAWSTDNQDLRVACCDLAVQDPKVVLAHAGNVAVVGGRHGTVYASAFMAKLPIVPERIIAVETVDCSTYSAPNIDVSLSDLVPL